MYVPRFDSNWSSQMRAFLEGRSDAWIMDHLYQICDSWGCKEKPYRIKDVLTEVMDSDGQDYLDALDLIDEWSLER